MRSPRRALFFDPYLGSLGGGERYLFSMAEWYRAERSNAVEVAGPSIPELATLERLGFPADFPMLPCTKWRYIGRSARYDLTVALANDPPPPSLARGAIIVVQFPFGRLSANALRRGAERWTLRRSRCVVYSEYVRTWLHRRWGTDATVIAPPVRLGSYEPAAKRHTILNVGRFFPTQHSKRQDALVDAFRRLPSEVQKEWRLVLAGGVDGAEGHRYLDAVRVRAEGANIVIAPSIDQYQLDALYREASIYWHATGFGRAPEEPEKAEHFGMSTVEAMSRGAVPVVFDDGGQREIVDSSVGYRWLTTDELVSRTTALAESAHQREVLATSAAHASRRYGDAAFRQALDDLIAR